MRAIGYARISEDDQREGRGVARQKADILKVCAANGWTLTEVIMENDVSASRYSRKARPGYGRLLDALHAGDVDKVVVYDLDRLLRQPRELEDLIDLADRTPSLRIVNVTGETRLQTGDDRFVARVLVAKSAKESDDISRRVRRLKQELADQGRPSGGGRRPLGFAANRVDHDPDEAEGLRRAAGMILDGQSIASAARALIATGILREPVDRASRVLVRSLLSPRLAGLRVHHGEVIGPASWEPILDEVTAQRLHAVLDGGRYSVPVRPHLLSGLARCECGSLLATQRKAGVRHYVCKKGRGGCGALGVRGDRIEAHVLKKVDGWLASANMRRAMQRRLDGTTGDDEAELLAAITEGEQKLRQLAAQVGEFDISLSEWSAMRAPIQSRIDAARAQLGRVSRPRVKVDVEMIRRGWDRADLAEKRKILRLLIATVEVRKIGKGARRFDPERVKIVPSWA